MTAPDVFAHAFQRLSEAHEPKDPVSRRRRALDALARLGEQIRNDQGEQE